VGELGAQRGDVLAGERDVGAFQRPAVAQAGAGSATAVAVLVAKRLVWLEHAGGERAGIDGGVISAHEPDEPAVVGQDDAGETSLPTELVEPARRFVGGWPGELSVFVGVDHRQEVVASGEGLFGFDLGAKSGVGGAGRAFEHLDAEVSVLDRAGDRPAGSAGDEPGERAPELAARQRPGPTVDRWDTVGAAVLGAVGGDPGDEVDELFVGALGGLHLVGPGRVAGGVGKVGEQQRLIGGLQLLDHLDGAGGGVSDDPGGGGAGGVVLALEGTAGQLPPVGPAIGVALGGQAAAVEVFDLAVAHAGQERDHRVAGDMQHPAQDVERLGGVLLGDAGDPGPAVQEAVDRGGQPVCSVAPTWIAAAWIRARSSGRVLTLVALRPAATEMNRVLGLPPTPGSGCPEWTWLSK
jgi:hypothetical protein